MNRVRSLLSKRLQRFDVIQAEPLFLLLYLLGRVGLWEQECLFTMGRGKLYGSVKTKRAHPPPGICLAFVILFWKTCKCPMVEPGVHTKQRRIQGRVRGLRTPPSLPPIRSDACFRLKFLHRQDRISLFNWLVFFYKTRVAFCILSMFASARKAVYRANGDGRSQLEKQVVVSVRSNLPQKSSTVLSAPKFGPPNQTFLDPPLQKPHGGA